MKHLITLLIAAVALVAAPASAAELRLSAAASLREVLDDLATSFVRHHPGTTFVKQYGASGALARQIESGAPADLFISANREWVEYLAGKKLLDERSIETLAYNELVFAGRAGLKVNSVADVAKLERIAIGSPRSVPAGEYALAALKKAGVDRALERRLVMAKDVRECLLYAERGEVDGAFVYKTDLQGARSVRILFTVPQDLYPRISYPAALTTTGASRPEAREFLRFLATAEARNILVHRGFAVK